MGYDEKLVLGVAIEGGPLVTFEGEWTEKSYRQWQWHLGVHVERDMG
jgi:hypothetical protein